MYAVCTGQPQQSLFCQKNHMDFILPLTAPYTRFSSVQSLSQVRLFATPRTAVRQASLSITNSWSLLKLMSIESVMPSNHLILFCSYLESFPASVLPVTIQDWFPLGWTGWISLQSKGLSRVFSNTTVKKHQFFSAQLALWSNSHIHTWSLETQ